MDDAALLWQALGELPDPVSRPVFIVVSGLPGTGKSHFSRKLAEHLPSVIMESDALRKVLFPTPSYSADESQRLFRAIHRLIEELLRKGRRVILDATNLEERKRELLYSIAERLQARLILVRVEAPPELVRQRLEARETARDPQDKSDADWSVYQRMRPRREHIQRSHFAVDTSRDITPVIEKVLRAARR